MKQLITLFFSTIISLTFAQEISYYPKCSNCTAVSHNYYKLCYNEANEQASWVAYLLTSSEVKNKKCERTDNFRVDPSVSTGSATLDDYKGSSYDRGHLCPAADRHFSCDAISETFYMSNMSPQAPSFNRGIWAKLEEKVRSWRDFI